MGIITQRVLNIYIWVLKAYRQETGVFLSKKWGVKCSEFIKKKRDKINRKYRDFWFKCTAYGSSVVRLPWEHRKSDISHLFLHKPTVNIHFFKLQIQNWSMNTFTRLIRQILYKVQYTFNTLFCTSFIFVSVCIYSCYFLKK